MFLKKSFASKHFKLIFNQMTKLYSIETIGEGFSKRYFLLNDQKQKISFWNDLEYHVKSKDNIPDLFQCVIEIPFDNLGKFEMTKNEHHHPIKQDVRKSKYVPNEKELRYYPLFPLFNYGFIPQTWENSLAKDPRTKLFGDDDPIDLVELSDNAMKIGDIIKVRVIGSFGLIDQGEIDWKVFGLIEDEAEKLNIRTIQDFEKYKPGRIEDIKNWFVTYKTYDGKPKNSIFENGKLVGKEETIKIIHEANLEWRGLKAGSTHEGAYIEQLKKKGKNFYLA